MGRGPPVEKHWILESETQITVFWSVIINLSWWLVMHVFDSRIHFSPSSIPWSGFSRHSPPSWLSTCTRTCVISLSAAKFKIPFTTSWFRTQGKTLLMSAWKGPLLGWFQVLNCISMTIIRFLSHCKSLKMSLICHCFVLNAGFTYYLPKLTDLIFSSIVPRMQSVIELGRVVRDRKTMPVKYPLPELVVIHKDQECLDDVNKLQAYILDELNVKKLTMSTDKHQVSTCIAYYLAMK